MSKPFYAPIDEYTPGPMPYEGPKTSGTALRALSWDSLG